MIEIMSIPHTFGEGSRVLSLALPITSRSIADGKSPDPG
jgi:hypothetical protein